MTKRDYEMIAAVIKSVQKDHGTSLVITDITVKLGYLFKADNPRFDKDRFIAACID